MIAPGELIFQVGDMLIAAVGNINGKIIDAYEKIYTIEKDRGLKFDLVLNTGSFGIWPVRKYVPGLVNKKGGPGDFSYLYWKNWEAPVKTFFISGPQEDHIWLERRFQKNIGSTPFNIERNRLLRKLHHLPNGYVAKYNGMNIAGLGKVFSPKNYRAINTKNHKHYTELEVGKLLLHPEPIDILLTNQGPTGEKFGNKESHSDGIIQLIRTLKPKICLHSGYSFSKHYQQESIQIVSLDDLEILPLSYSKGKISFL